MQEQDRAAPLARKPQHEVACCVQESRPLARVSSGLERRQPGCELCMRNGAGKPLQKKKRQIASGRVAHCWVQHDAAQQPCRHPSALDSMQYSKSSLQDPSAPRALSSSNCRSTRGLPPSTARGIEEEMRCWAGGQVGRNAAAVGQNVNCCWPGLAPHCLQQHLLRNLSGQENNQFPSACLRSDRTLLQPAAPPCCTSLVDSSTAQLHFPCLPALGSNVSCSQRDCLR